MLLYWNNATASGYWDDTGNWWEDSTGTTTPHGALPVSGDSCSLASNAGTNQPTINTATVDLGTGVCDIYGGTLSALGTIAGGTFTNPWTMYGAITGGTFTGFANQYNSGCTISGGTFTSSSAYFNSGCTISGGAFTSATANFQYGCSVNGGAFTCWYTWNATITGGIWVLSGTATVNGYTVTGASQNNPGFSIVVSGPTLPAAGNVMYGIDRGDGVNGTHTDPNTDTHTPNAALVLNTAHFGAGNATAGTLDLTTYTLISSVVAAEDVRHGTARYSGGSNGTAYIPTATQTLYGVNVDATTGTVTLPNTGPPYTPDASLVLNTAHFGAGNATAGTYASGTIPAASDVRHGIAVGSGTGTCYVPAAGDVRHGTNVDATTGTAYIPAASDTRHGVAVDATTGTCYVPTAAQTLYGVSVDVAGTGTVTLPNTDGYTADPSQVSSAAHFGAGNATAGTLDMSLYVLIADLVSPANVLLGIPIYAGCPSDMNGSYSGYNLGGLTPAQVAQLLAAYNASTNSAANATLNPVLPNGDLSLVAGNSYDASRGNLIVIDASQWPDLTGATVTLQLKLASTGAPDGAQISGIVRSAGESDQAVQFTLCKAFTAALQAGLGSAGYHNHTYTVTAAWTAGGDDWSPPRGNASVSVA